MLGTVNVRVQSYGKLADLLGAERSIDMSGPCTFADLRAKLAAECPEAAEVLANRRVMACVGDEMVPDDRLIAGDASIELLSPVSGG